MILKDAIDYYKSNCSCVLCILCLMQQGRFNRVIYCSLFRSLMNRDFPSTVLRLLLNIYRLSNGVFWNGVVFPQFTVSNRMKQGGILSVVLFCIYIDSLLHSLAFAALSADFLSVLWCMQMILFCRLLQLVVCRPCSIL